jgi:hypothetical protein
MNTITLSKWQAEVLREAFAMLAKEEWQAATPADREITYRAGREGQGPPEANEQLSFAI